MNRLRRILPLLLLLRGTCGTFAAEGDGPTLWDLRHNPLTLNEYVFTEQEHQHGGSNNLFCVCVLDDGWIIVFDLFHYTFGLFEKWGMYAICGDGSRIERTITHELDRKNIVIDEHTLFVSDGNSTIQGEGSGFRITAKYDDFSCDLSFTNLIPPWKRRNGYHYVDESKSVFMYRVVPGPWERVEGTYTYEGMTRTARGNAYIDRTFQVFPPLKIDPLIVSMRLFSGTDTPPRDNRYYTGPPERPEWHLNIIEHVSHNAYGGKRDPLLMIARNGEWAFISEDYTVSYEDFRKEMNIPYEYPGTVLIEAEDNGRKFSGRYTAEQLFNFTDVLDEVPAVLRPIALLIMRRPVFFRMIGRMTGCLTDPEGKTEYIDLHGLFEYVVVQ